MADNNISALAAIAPVAQRNNAPQGSTQQADQPAQPSFSQVLKSRTQSAEKSPPKTAEKPAGSKSGARAEGLPDKASAKNEELPAEAGTGLPGELANLAQLLAADPRTPRADAPADDASSDEEARLANPDALLAAQVAEVAPPVQDPASAAAALAAATANLAGQSAAQNSQNAANQVSEDGRKSLDAAAGVLDARRGTEQGKELPAATGISERTPTNVVEFNPNAADSRNSGQNSERGGSFASELTLAQTQASQASQSSQALNGLQQPRLNEVVPRHEVSTPVATRGWAEEIGQKISWVATQDKGRAELVLNPPQMGRIEVSINLNGDQASAHFAAANPIAREALQDALPRLREVLADAGIQLGQANVNAGNSGQAQSDAPSQRSASSHYGQRDAASLEPLVAASHASWARSGSGMVDTFA